MNISIGSQLGPYVILAAAGAGGMGEVYKAKDTRLDRVVAIKVLPAHLSGAAELRERFEREARTISSLNHPNICVLYDVGHQDGIDFLVMEYLQGETLADRLKKGPMAPDQALKCGIEIAAALDKAHRQGVMHRDLKPGNIMLTEAGAKLLDFGLAKFKSSVSIQTASVMPTQGGPASLTVQGTILGTLQYMPPEQVEGQETDVRSDIFSFGAVLYEMLTGRKAFEGKSQASLIAAIIHVDPAPPCAVQSNVPPAVDRVVKKCLAKDPDERWQTAHDLLDELRWIASGGAVEIQQAQPAAPAAALPRLAWVIAALFLLCSIVLAGAVIIGLRREPPAAVPVRFELPPPEGKTFNGGPNVPHFAISPDSRFFAFSVIEGNRPVIWVHPFDSLTSQPLPGTTDGSTPFWSPDGHYIGFIAAGKLKKIEVSGGMPQTLCDVGYMFGGATWGSAGVIVFGRTTDSPSGLFRVSENGGEAAPVTRLDQREIAQIWPQFLPDGRHFIYLSIARNPNASGIYAASLDGGEPKLVVPARVRAAYAAGYLLFVRGTALMAQPFDTGKLSLTGEPVRLDDQIMGNNLAGNSPFTASDTGVLAYRTGRIGAETQLVWADPKGTRSAPFGEKAMYRGFDISPDGKRIVTHVHEIDVLGKGRTSQGGDLWILEPDRSIKTRFTFDSGHSIRPIWSPDGKKIVYSSSKDGGTFDLYAKTSSGAVNEEVLLKTNSNKVAEDWSRDGKLLVYTETDPATKNDLWVLPMTGGAKPYPLLKTPFNENSARFSPDGKWIAYGSDESGTDQVYVQPYPLNGGKWQISTNGGIQPAWSLDGKELYYVRVITAGSELRLISVAVNFSPEPHPSAPVERFAFVPSGTLDVAQQFAVSADGRSFLIPNYSTIVGPSPITLVFNWTALLGKK
jgi:eukaryotic-like serine/threonine-protein kinase